MTQDLIHLSQETFHEDSTGREDCGLSGNMTSRRPALMAAPAWGRGGGLWRVPRPLISGANCRHQNVHGPVACVRLHACSQTLESGVIIHGGSKGPHTMVCAGA